MEAMAAMEVVATEGAGMATSREEEAMEVADMGAMEVVGDTVDTEGAVEGMEAMQGVDMEAMAVAEEEEGGVMMMVSMLACQPDVWLLSVAPFRFIRLFLPRNCRVWRLALRRPRALPVPAVLPPSPLQPYIVQEQTRTVVLAPFLYPNIIHCPYNASRETWWEWRVLLSSEEGESFLFRGGPLCVDQGFVRL